MIENTFAYIFNKKYFFRGYMRKKTLILILFLLFFIFNQLICNLNFSVKALDFSAKAYILYCPENKKILLEKSIRKLFEVSKTKLNIY